MKRGETQHDHRADNRPVVQCVGCRKPLSPEDDGGLCWDCTCKEAQRENVARMRAHAGRGPKRSVPQRKSIRRNR